MYDGIDAVRTNPSVKPQRIAANRFLTEGDELVFLIEEVTRKLRKRFDASLEQYGLTRTQWRTLAYLFRLGGMTQTKLAGYLELERASIGLAIDRLEALGYVERRGSQDRRVWMVHLKPAARALLPELRNKADAVYALMLREVSTSNLAVTRQVLLRIAKNLEAD